MSYEVALYESKYQPQVIALHEAVLREFGRGGGDPEIDTDLQEIPIHYRVFLLALLDGQVVGMGGLRHKRGTIAEIKRIRVAKAHRRQGLATRILQELESEAAERRYRTVILDTPVQQKK